MGVILLATQQKAKGLNNLDALRFPYIYIDDGKTERNNIYKPRFPKLRIYSVELMMIYRASFRRSSGRNKEVTTV